MKRRRFIQSAAAAPALPFLAQSAPPTLEAVFRNPPPDAGLSVVYHWTAGVVSKAGITADMEGIAASGIDTVNWFYFDGAGPTDGAAAPLCKSPEWWDFVDHLYKEARRNKLTIAPHVCSSWGPAGSAEITPELSQQHVVWTQAVINGGQPFTAPLARPQRAAAASSGFGVRAINFPDPVKNYYQDIAVLAFPVPPGYGETSVTRKANLTTTLPITDLAKAADPANTDRIVDTTSPGYLQFAFDQPFTLRAVTVNPGIGAGGFSPGAMAGQRSPANPYRIAHSLEVHASDDGTTFRPIGRLEPMFNGWQSTASILTHTVRETTARYFRLVYIPSPPIGYDEGMRTGTRTGGGDFPNMIEPLGLAHVVLHSAATVHHLPGKANATWGKSRLVTGDEIPASACVPLNAVIDLTSRLKPDGTLDAWTPPAGRWIVQRIGAISALAATGGGLQCDKLSPEAAAIVYRSWFAELRSRLPGAESLVTVLNIDSWECRSQSWSPLLPKEFLARRGYDLRKYLPALTGVMLESATATEGFLLDFRRTISEAISENHFGTMHRLARQNNCLVMIEDVNPAVNIDGMEHYRNCDWAGGEFWVRASQNWKPNDIRDAVAGARLYGKKVIFAEAWTGGGWQDDPFALKAMGDHNFVEGINRMMLHVWNEQYHPARAPGMPGAGTPFNHLNTWWKAGQPWRDYLKRCQALLQEGQPVADVLYFAGENIPCRSLLKPTQGSCWFTDPPLPEGYAHDTINRDALLRLAKVVNGRIVVNGLSYRLLVLKGDEPYLTPAVAARLRQLVLAGAVVYGPRPRFSPSNEQGPAGQAAVRSIAAELWGAIDGRAVTENRVGQGRVIHGQPLAQVLASLKAEPDVLFLNAVETGTTKPVKATASSVLGTLPVAAGAERKGWGLEACHRRGPGWDLYFLSNQEFFNVSADVSFRLTGRVPELWNPETGRIAEAAEWREENGRLVLPYQFDPSGAIFVLFRKPGAGGRRPAKTVSKQAPAALPLDGAWSVTFPLKNGPRTLDLPAASWTTHADEEIKYFSGTATCRRRFTLPAALKQPGLKLYLDLGQVANLARVRLNHHDLGVIWKAPFVVEVTEAAAAGDNTLELEITNTWVNRLLGDSKKPEADRVTFVAPSRFSRGPQFTEPLPAGLLGPVRIFAQ